MYGHNQHEEIHVAENQTDRPLRDRTYTALEEINQIANQNIQQALDALIQTNVEWRLRQAEDTSNVVTLRDGEGHWWVSRNGGEHFRTIGECDDNQHEGCGYSADEIEGLWGVDNGEGPDGVDAPADSFEAFENGLFRLLFGPRP